MRDNPHAREMIVVAGKNPTLKVSSMDSAMRKTSEIVAAETTPDFSPPLLAVCMVNRQTRKTSPKPKTILPSNGNVGITTTTGKRMAISLSPETTINLVMKTWKTSIKVNSVANRMVVSHVNTIPDNRESDKTSRTAKKLKDKSFQKKK